MSPERKHTPTDLAVLAQNLTKRFGDETAVNDLNFYVERGKIFGFIGPSGCGKTTTIRLLTGIYTPTEGQVSVLNADPQHFTPGMRARMGYMPQLFVMFPDLSLTENLNFAASVYGMNIFGRGKRMKEMLDFVELYPHRNKLARNISGGMQRRLALAATLVHNPELVFLDEPTAGIDPVLRRKFWEHFRQLRDSGKTLFVTTQYVGEAAYCDLVGVMAAGKLLMVETPEGLRRRALGGEVVDVKLSQALDWNTANLIRGLVSVRFENADLESENAVIIRQVNILPDGSVRITVQEASTAIPALLEWFRTRNIEVESINEFLPPYDDVFVQIVQEEAGDETAA